ncbi:MAG: RdgB/HAM1 family non-canonical purine NTP pyrophosphatase [Atribacterota bacterium]|nr:RdgB/HAM1 family non-canonical purine NTP pyrophosphatase [Atribacterota bacterium]MDD4896844.1 RdgB/HAM1 family non-canonical purine NTP pyrophosphatase [Atribacterota bacterium]MDD5636240.1 RdgB/HAM1 family non-canonical purine NTP pyrophosphatase [Atribacterota bacterium]
MLRLILATRNEGKVKEIRAKLKDYPIVVECLQNYPQIPEIEENGKTFSDNAVLKATIVSHYTNLPALADDSGLEIDSLGGKPGVYSARWGKTDEERIEKVLKELQGITEKQRKACFICVMSLVIPENIVYTTKGICSGKITLLPRGQSGFGYDPIFIPDGYELTFAQMGEQIKNKISHRSIALDKIVQKIIVHYNFKKLSE